MCRQTEGTFTTARRCCGVFRDSGGGYKTADLLTYLISILTAAVLGSKQLRTIRYGCLNLTAVLAK